MPAELSGLRNPAVYRLSTAVPAASIPLSREIERIPRNRIPGPMLYLVVEHFRDGDPRPVYARFAARGRLAGDGLRYVNSWVTADLRHCYQIMECADRALLDAWMSNWGDLVEFEVHDVITSPEAAAAVAALPKS